MFVQVFNILNWTIVAILIFSVLLMAIKIYAHIYGLMPSKKFKDAKSNHKYAIIVPARNESHVINTLLTSLSNQDYPKDKYDIYVIVENEEDPTVEICKNYSNVFTFIRPNLDIKTKGAAIDQLLKYLINEKIAEEKSYEAYFIFDADNWVKNNYLCEMNKCFDQGYDIALSYRNSGNWNGGWIASCSALTFSMLNTFSNKFRARFCENVLVQGTGFYISAKVIDELGGYPFYCLTEDVELSNYAVIHNIKGTYNENTELFDVQTTNFKENWNQRVRWVKGHLQVSKKYYKELLKTSITSKQNKFSKFSFAINIIPIAIPVFSIIAYCFALFVLGIVGCCLKVDTMLWASCFILLACSFVGIYIFLMLYTMAMLYCERKHTNLTKRNFVKTVLLNPFFMAMWLPIGIFAIFKKQINWKVINHPSTLTTSPIQNCNQKKA